MIIKVMNRTEACRYSYSPHSEKSAVISIGDIGSTYKEAVYPSPYNGICAVLPLRFDDVDGGENCMVVEEAVRIMTFVERHRDKLIIVHCDGGVSRSAGVAAALMKFYNGDDTPIFDNPRYCPNMLCYRLMLNVLTGNY